jgi:hypothetical protein
MSVSKSISLNRVRRELETCADYGKKCGWLISAIDESNQSFTVTMISNIDKEVYILEVMFTDYPELPLILEFVDPKTAVRGTRNAYPDYNDSFFNKSNPPCICNPCSRKSYKEFHSFGLHADWQMIGWQQNPKVTSLINLDAILKCIYTRINTDENYKGRMV